MKVLPDTAEQTGGDAPDRQCPHGSASATVIDALEDEHWRPREMALKVVAKRLVHGDIDAVARLQDDPSRESKRPPAGL